MPDLSKKTRKESQSILNSMNLEYNIKGNGDFISQSPRPGQKLGGSESITLNYSKRDEDFDKPSEENSNNKSYNEEKNYNSEKKSEVNKKNKENNKGNNKENNKEIKKSTSKKKKSKENLENNNRESNKNKRD